MRLLKQLLMKCLYTKVQQEYLTVKKMLLQLSRVERLYLVMLLLSDMKVLRVALV